MKIAVKLASKFVKNYIHLVHFKNIKGKQYYCVKIILSDNLLRTKYQINHLVLLVRWLLQDTDTSI